MKGSLNIVKYVCPSSLLILMLANMNYVTGDEVVGGGSQSYYNHYYHYHYRSSYYYYISPLLLQFCPCLFLLSSVTVIGVFSSTFQYPYYHPNSQIFTTNHTHTLPFSTTGGEAIFCAFEARENSLLPQIMWRKDERKGKLEWEQRQKQRGINSFHKAEHACSFTTRLGLINNFAGCLNWLWAQSNHTRLVRLQAFLYCSQ